MSPELASLLACLVCRRDLTEFETTLRCENCGANFPVIGGVPVFLDDPNAVTRMPNEHESNSLGTEFEAILAAGHDLVLNLGAGSTIAKYPNCIELESKIFRHTDVVGDAHALPFRDEIFDRVFAFNVFEHLREPALAAREIHRVLKPGGALVIHTAFLQPLHEAPHHYYNATEFGVREWFREFEIETCDVSGNFSPGFMLGFLSATLLDGLREGGIPERTRMQIANTRLRDWAHFWHQKSDPPPGFDALLTLPQKLQKRIAGGFELRARKQGVVPDGA